MVSIKRYGPEDTDVLDKYAGIPMYVEVDRILECKAIEDGMGGLMLCERHVDAPFIKNYENGDDSPFPLNSKWDVSKWAVFAAQKDERVVGGCVVAFQTEEVHMLEGRRDIAVLWDIRVDPRMKRKGIGTQLFRKAKEFSQELRCKYLKIETQNVNVPACRFYSKQGCHLGGILTHAYADLPDEVQLLWYLPL